MLQGRIIKKDKRENKMVVYTEEDKELVIPVGLGNFGGGGSSSRLQDKSVTQNTQTASYEPDAGYDGLSKINVDATPYGNTKERQGYNRGYTTGWNEGYPQGVNDGFVSGHESGYTDGYAEGEVVGQARGYVIGHASGVTDGIAEQKAKLQSATFESNGTYTREDGWSAVTVDMKSNLAIADVRLNSIQQTFYKDNLVQGPNGETAYGGNLDDFKAYIDEKQKVQIKSWYNPEQTSSILQAIIQQNSAGTYEWIAYQAEPFIITPLEDIPSTWTQMDTYGGLFARYDGTNLYIYWNYQYGTFFTDSRDRILPDEDLFFSRGYDGISALTVNGQAIYNSGYTKGYKDRGELPSVENFFSLGFILSYDPDYGLTKDNIRTINLMDNGSPLYPIYYEGQPTADFDINTTHSGNTTEIWLTGELVPFGELACDGFQFELYNPVTNLGSGGKVWVNAVEDSGSKVGGFKPSINSMVNTGTTITINV